MTLCTHQLLEVPFLGKVEQLLDPVWRLSLSSYPVLEVPDLLPPPPLPQVCLHALHRAVEEPGAPAQTGAELLKCSPIHSLVHTEHSRS